MKTQLTPRLEHSITVLYNAFHNGTLNAFDCKACAVGNIVGHDKWSMNAIDVDGSAFKLVNRASIIFPYSNYYSGFELFEVERIFLSEWVKNKTLAGFDKEIQFKGLCAVIKYLCELDGVENVMDYTKLFETENNEPVYELQF